MSSHSKECIWNPSLEVSNWDQRVSEPTFLLGARFPHHPQRLGKGPLSTVGRLSFTLTIPSERCHHCSSSNNTEAASRPQASAWDTQLLDLVIFSLAGWDFDLSQSVSWQCTSKGTGDVSVPAPSPEFRMSPIFISSLSYPQWLSYLLLRDQKSSWEASNLPWHSLLAVTKAALHQVSFCPLLSRFASWNQWLSK